MTFVLKKVLGLVVQPLFLVVALLVAGGVLLWRRQNPTLGRWLTTLGTLLLLLISLKPLPHTLGHLLERQYQPYTIDSVGTPPAYVVVLGGGIREDDRLPLSARLSSPALARLVEGVRIVQGHPGALLVVTGGKVFSRISEASVAAEVATMLGVDPARIVVEDQSLDTHDQALQILSIAGDQPVVLVTSAIHMPRSMALFRGAGLEPVAAPTGHLFSDGLYSGPSTFLPSSEHLRAMEVVMHEIYGLAWSWLRGHV